jgi:hypothetical protein
MLEASLASALNQNGYGDDWWFSCMISQPLDDADDEDLADKEDDGSADE